MLAEPARFKGKRVGLVLCGGNIDPRILASIMIRELERDSRIVSFRLTIADRPGLLGQIATMLGEARSQHPGGRAPAGIAQQGIAPFGTGHVGEIFLQILAGPFGLGFLEAALEIGDDAFEQHTVV